MKVPRVSLATVGFIVLVCAVDFGILREVSISQQRYWGLAALFSLPMIDALMIVVFRMRRPRRRTSGEIGFLIAGTAATIATLAVGVIAPGEQLNMLRATMYPVFPAFTDWVARQFGNAFLQSTPMTIVLVLVFEICLPIVYFSGPPMVAGLLGRTIGRRIERRRKTVATPLTCVPTGGPALA